MSLQPEKSLVIVPTYNEAANVPVLVDIIKNLQVQIDILIVDDGSPDGTGAIATALSKLHDFVFVMNRGEKNGLGKAYCAGMKWALERDYEYILEMDADLSHDPRDIPAFLLAAQHGDLVLGTRYGGGCRVLNWAIRRLLLSLAASYYVRLLTGMPYTDPTSGYKCFRRRALEMIDLDAVQSCGYFFQIEVTHTIWRRGGTIKEIPIVFTERSQGRSKMSRDIVWEALWGVWRLLFRHKLRSLPSWRRVLAARR